MATEASAHASSALILERIEDLRKDFQENKTSLNCLVKDLGDFRLHYTGEHQRVVMQTEASHKRLDDHERRLQEIEKILPSLVMTGKALTFVGSAVVLSILGLIWALVTGQATVVIP